MRRAIGATALRHAVIGAAPDSPLVAAVAQRLHRPHGRGGGGRQRGAGGRSAPPADCSQGRRPHRPASGGGAQRTDARRQQNAEVASASPLDATLSLTGPSRFLHRHGAPFNKAGERYVSQNVPGVACHRKGEAAPRVSQTSFQRLLKIHMAMRNNYESLRQSHHVVTSFSMACAEALLELGLPLRRAGGPDEKKGCDMSVRTCDAPPTDKDTPLVLLLSETTPLYTAPISFPPPPLKALLHMADFPKQTVCKGSGDFLLAAMEVANGTDTADLLMGPEKVVGNPADDVDVSSVWGTITPGLESIFACLHNVPVAGIVQLMETVAYFKWVKDEEALEWRKGIVMGRLRDAVSVFLAASSKNQEKATATTHHSASGDVNEARREVKLAVEALLSRIPRVDCAKTTHAILSPAPMNLSVHVIDVMLNVLMRVCLWRWPSLECGDQAAVMHICTFPWFTRDLSVEAAAWTTYYHLRAIFLRDMGMDYYRAFFYVQRIRRLCLPSIYDVDTAFIQRLFQLEGKEAAAVSTATDRDDVGSGSKGEAQETSLNGTLSFKELMCVLCSTQERQRVAYELLLVWLKQTHPTDLQSTSPNGRHVSAAGIAIADVDHFVMKRFHAKMTAGQWVLLSVPDDSATALAHITQGSQTPYALTRLYMCNYHNVLPHIWNSITAKRRELLWTAWLRGVSRPLVDVFVASSVRGKEQEKERLLHFLEPLLAIFASDVMFLRFITRLVILSLQEMVTASHRQPLEELCTRLIELVYTGGLILYTGIVDASEGGTSVDMATFNPTATGVKAEEQLLKKPHAHQQQQQSAVIAIRRSFKEVFSTLVQRLDSEHVPSAYRLLNVLFEPDGCGTVGQSLLRGIQRGVRSICDDESRDVLSEWLRRQSFLASTQKTFLEEPLFRRWQLLAERADAGLPATLPSLMEICRGLLELLKVRGHHIFNEQQKQEQEEQQRCVGDATDATDAGNHSGSVFTVCELQVILTVLSRAIISRNLTLKTVRAMSFSHAMDALTAPLSDQETSNEDSNKNNSRGNVGGGRSLSEGQTAVVVADAATNRAVQLEKLLSMEVASKVHELPWTSLLEAVLLYLAPYDALGRLRKTLRDGQSSGDAQHNNFMLQMVEDFQTRRHKRLVGNLVLFWYYRFAMRHDGGWAGGTLTQQADKQEADADHARSGTESLDTPMPHSEDCQIHEETWVLLRTLLQVEMGDAKMTEFKKNRAEGGVNAVEKEEEGEGSVRQEKLERILACHTFAAYMQLMSFSSCVLKWPFSLCAAYERFLYFVETAVENSNASSYGENDMLFLWLAASATVAGVRFSPTRTCMWSTVGITPASLESGDKTQCVSLEEKTMRLVCILAPSVRSELLRSNLRLKFLVNTIVAIQAFGRLGISMDTSGLNLDQLLLHASADRRLLHRHLNLFLVGCSALPSTRNALLNTASYLREVRNVLSLTEINRAFVAIALSADTFARHHETQADLQQNAALLDVTHSTAPTMRVTPTQLRHAWSALARRVLDCAEETSTDVFVRGIQCAGAVACVDTRVFQQLLSFVVEHRQDELSLSDWTAILHTARQSVEGRRGLEDYLRGPLTVFLLKLLRQSDGGRAQSAEDAAAGAERLVGELCHFVEALPAMFVGDAVFWALLRRVLKAQWKARLETASGAAEGHQQPAAWLQELTRSYEWAARTAGHHDLSTIPIF